MKRVITRWSLTLVIIIFIGTLFGCSQKNNPISQDKIYTNVGFIDNIISESGKNFIQIGIHGGNLKLEVKDEDTFNLLEEGGFYKFAFNEESVLLSIDKDNYIETLVKNSMEEGLIPGEDNPIEKRISSSDKISTEGLTLLDFYEFDITGDGSQETISMYVDAEEGPDGEIYWDDGQDWLFLVEGQEEDYILFQDYLQIASLQFYIYTVDDDFYITTIQSGTANLEVTEYQYHPESSEFISTLKHGTRGNVNMLHSSQGY